MVRKIKTVKADTPMKVDGSQLNSKSYLKMLSEVNDVNKMKEFLDTIKEIDDETIRGMEVGKLLDILPQSVKSHFMNIISGAGIGKLTEQQKNIFITQNYDMIKDMLIDMILSFKQETPETIQMEKEFTDSFKEYEKEYAKSQEIQYEFCKLLRNQRIINTEKLLNKTHGLDKKKNIQKMLDVLKSIETFDILATRLNKAGEKSKILQLCLQEKSGSSLEHDTLLTIGATATKLLLEKLMNAKEYYHDPREFTAIIYSKLFEPSEENMEIITYFWLGYTAAIIEREIGTVMRTFILDTSINWIFLAKNEIPEEDKKNLKEAIIKSANDIKSIIDKKIAEKKEIVK